MKFYIIDSDKIEGSLANKYRKGKNAFAVDSSGSYYKEHVNKNLSGKQYDKYLNTIYRPQGSLVSLKDARNHGINSEEMILVDIPKKNIKLHSGHLFPKVGCKPKIIEEGYKPNRFNSNKYLESSKSAAKKTPIKKSTSKITNKKSKQTNKTTSKYKKPIKTAKKSVKATTKKK